MFTIASEVKNTLVADNKGRAPCLQAFQSHIHSCYKSTKVLSPYAKNIEQEEHHSEHLARKKDEKLHKIKNKSLLA